MGFIIITNCICSLFMVDRIGIGLGDHLPASNGKLFANIQLQLSGRAVSATTSGMDSIVLTTETGIH
jgi:hypothetical protein